MVELGPVLDASSVGFRRRGDEEVDFSLSLMTVRRS
jgi:hypothetical protein